MQTADELDLQGAQAALKKSASWFYWIAALSIINSLIMTFGGDISFVMGLGATLIVDGFAIGMIQEGAPSWVQYIAFGVSLFVAGIFALFAIAGNKRIMWVYTIGVVLYFLDALIYFAFEDWVPVGFHALALFYLFKAYPAAKEVRRLETAAGQPIEVPAASV